MAGSMPIGKRLEVGFAYVLLLVSVALIGTAFSATIGLGATMARRDAELQLMSIGLEFQQALRSYADAPSGTALPPGMRGPRRLQDLLKDPRVPGVRRHLRQLYADPLTGREEWGVLTDPAGFIVGIYSLAQGRPIRREGFDPALPGFEQAQSYQQWVFTRR
jgi:hypothetical protein